jgi:FkbM family methyltransferase
MTPDTEFPRAASPLGAKRVALAGLSLPPMVSYAQNFEDVIIRRALQDINAGFYIDIGAFDATKDSVTRWFYDNGWHGVNIEPNPALCENLKRDRPRDENLCCAISCQSGWGDLKIIQDTGLSTLCEREALVAAQAGYTVSRRLQVPLYRLDEILGRYGSNQTIDFLKIDAEGSEGDILKEPGFVEACPRLIIVEAIKSFSTERSWETWEPRLTANGFRFVWFDGINRFYIREEDAWREELFGIPPCAFDHFTPHYYAAAVQELAARANRIATLECEVHRVNVALDLERVERHDLEARLNEYSRTVRRA